MRKLFGKTVLIPLFVLFLATCSLGGDNAAIRISFGQGNKAAVSVDEIRHVVTLEGPTGRHTLNISGAGSAKASVAPGTWRIAVEGFYGNDLYSIGSATTDVKAGRTTNVSVYMTVVWAGGGSGSGGAALGGGGGTPASGITVTVSPSVVSVEISQSLQFSALVNGSAIQGVTWSLANNTSTATNIDPTGLLYVDSSETIGTMLAVKAISQADPSKSGNATITVSSLPTLTGSVSITGDDWENATLTAAYVLASGNGSGTPAYKWRRNGIEIPGATSATYTLTDTDRGQNITATVEFSGNSNLVQSSPQPIQYLTGIYNQTQLEAIRLSTHNLSKNYILVVTNLPLSGNWIPIGTSGGAFTGSFDGLGNTISGLTINTSSDCQGLFGYVNGGVVKNLELTGVSITSGRYTGAVAGYNNGGTIDSCSVAGNISSNNDYVGGVVGFNNNYGMIQNCHSSGSVISSGSYGCTGGVLGVNNENSTIQNCYTTANVSGIDYVGGVSGSNTHTSFIINCYATGTVTSSGTNVGGISGSNNTNNSQIISCVALNPTITRISGTGTNFGRVTGSNDTTLSSNYADSAMTAIGVSFAGTNAGNDLGGADVYAGTGAGQYNNAGFWSGLGWDFSTGTA